MSFPAPPHTQPSLQQARPERTDIESSRNGHPTSGAGSPPSLAALARRVNEAHRAYERRMGDGLAHAIDAGRALLEAKEHLTDREWVRWRNQSFNFSERTGQLYVQVARAGAGVDVESFGPISLRAFAKAIAIPRERDQPPAAASAPIPSCSEAAVSARSSAAATVPGRVSPRATATPANGRTSAPRTSCDPKFDKVSRARGVLSAIDPLLERSQDEELPTRAAAGLLLEAATAARTVADTLEALAHELEK